MYVPSRALKMTSSCVSTAQLPRKVWLLTLAEQWLMVWLHISLSCDENLVSYILYCAL